MYPYMFLQLVAGDHDILREFSKPKGGASQIKGHKLDSQDEYVHQGRQAVIDAFLGKSVCEA
jgi:hypothetical protein